MKKLSFRENKHSFLNSIAKFSISSWVNLIINVLAVVITTRVFTPEIFGTLNLFNTASTMLVGFVGLGLDGAATRFFNEPPPGWTRNQVIGCCLSISVSFLLICTAVGLLFFANDISLMLFNRASLFLTVLVSVNTLSLLVLNSYFSMYYRMSNDPKHYTIQQILVVFFSRLFVVSAALFSPTVETVIAFNVTGLFLLMVVYFFIQKDDLLPKEWHNGSEGFGEVLRFGLFGWPVNFALNLNTFMIPLIISMNLDKASLGIYASANFFVSAFGVVQGGFRTFWGGFMYAHYRDQQEKIIKVHDYVVLGIIAVLAGFIVFQHIAYMFIGSAFHGSRAFFCLVLLDPLFSLLEQTTNYGIALSKKNHESTIIYVSAVFLSIGLVYCFTKEWGLIGAAIASATAATLRMAALTWRGQKYYTSIDSIKRTAWGVICILILAVSNCVLVNEYCWELFIMICICLFVGVIYKLNIRRMVYNIYGC